VRTPRFFWRLIQIGPRVAYALGLGPIVGRFVLLLTTTGRKSGRPVVTPLLFEQTEGTYLVASARGHSADWLRNIRVAPDVHVRVGALSFDARAEVVRDASKVADYLQRQMDRNPRAFGAILRFEGLSRTPSRDELEKLATKRPMVALHPARRSLADAIPNAGIDRCCLTTRWS